MSHCYNPAISFGHIKVGMFAHYVVLKLQKILSLKVICNPVKIRLAERNILHLKTSDLDNAEM